MRVTLFNVHNLHYAYLDKQEYVSDHWLISLAYVIFKARWPRLMGSRRQRLVIASIYFFIRRAKKIRLLSHRVKVCAWCKKRMGLYSKLFYPLANKKRLSHGCCKKCYKKEMESLSTVAQAKRILEVS